MKNYFILFLFFISVGANAIKCKSNCGDSVTLLISQTLSTGENNIGHQVNSSTIMVDDIRVAMDKGTASTAFQYYSEPMPHEGIRENDWSYRRVDDYISIALRTIDLCYDGPIYAPFNLLGRVQNKGCIPYNYKHSTNSTVHQGFETRIRIDKKLVSGTYTRNIPVGYFKLCQAKGCIILKTIYLSLNITVRESCVINAGQIIDVNFPSVPVSAFRSAGQKAVGIAPAVRTVAVSCTNINPQTNLSLRVQANNVSGNAIVSDNPDVGFVISGSDGKELTPNDTSSLIPFSLGDNSQSNVPINVYPISVTGKKPAVGVVTSMAYLRVDFN